MVTEQVGVWHVTAILDPELPLCRFLIESTTDVGDPLTLPPIQTIDRDKVLAELRAWLDRLTLSPRPGLEEAPSALRNSSQR
ncbi:MAG: hypothetical protein H0V33_07415 [Acidimicrobiia bacterium]|nr:hypothetical protein [Acidimicrobiia bacterium]